MSDIDPPRDEDPRADLDGPAPEESPEAPFDAPLEVPVELAGERLDAILATLSPAVSRSRWKTQIQAGGVSVDGEVCKRPNRSMGTGTLITAERPQAAPSKDVQGRPIQDFGVLHEDETIIVIEKPAGLVVHPNERHPSGGTLADLVRERYGDLPSIQGDFRPGIVHRLDRLTSGVMILGRTEAALQHLKQQFKDRRVQKHYLALVHSESRFASDWIESRIAPEARNPRRMRVLPPESEDEGRDAKTFYEVLERFGYASYLACQPKTGRTHQLRVHLMSVGLPIIGDRIYKHRGSLPRPLPAGATAPMRQALHAARIEFDHPDDERRMSFEVPMPEDMRVLLQALRDGVPSPEE